MNHLKRNLISALVILISINGISQISPNHYLINFTDKNNSKYSVSNPEKFLSQRSIARRLKYKIPITNQDIPVNQNYMDSIKQMGFEIENVSKWFNSISVYTPDSNLVRKLDKISFVKSDGNNKKSGQIKKKSQIVESELKQSKNQSFDTSLYKIYGESLTQIRLNNGQLMHKEGYFGQGMQIAILDGGFYKVDEFPAFDSLRINHQILGARDFVHDSIDIYNAATHGMMVLSTMAGNIPGKLLGTAPKASYWLLRSEQTASEYLIEEHNWVAAAEFADSVGVDLINSSLGYTIFDDNINDHTYSDLDGNTTIISRAADIASSKGILVVTSAGNSGSNSWHYVESPADADSVLAVGAIMNDGKRAYFSSFGPSVDKRIKPDVCALGFQSVLSGSYGQVSRSSGTSFSAPIMAGMIACLWQAHPKLNNMQIIDIVKRSSSQFSLPDSILGYGIPDIYAAHVYLNSIGYNEYNSPAKINAFPNPFNNSFHIEYLSQLTDLPYDMNIELFDIQGKMVWKKEISELKNNKVLQSVSDLNNLKNGMYIVRLTANDIVFNKKVIKN